MPSSEISDELNVWIAHNTALLNTAAAAADTPSDVDQVIQSAAAYLRALEARERAAVAALEAIQQELAAGRPYRQRQTTWARRQARLQQEIAAHRQARAVLRDQIAATRQLLTRLQEKSFSPSSAGYVAGTPPMSALSRVLHVLQTGFITTSYLRKSIVGLGIILVLGLGFISILVPVSTRAPAVYFGTADHGVPTSIIGPATEEADTIQRSSAWTIILDTTVQPAVKPSPIATVTPELSPTATSTPKPSPTMLPTVRLSSSPTLLTIANANANLRAGPGTAHPIVSVLMAGQPVTIVARDPTGDWYQLTNGAWIYSALVSNAPTVPVAAVIPTAPPPTFTSLPPPATHFVVASPAATPAPPARYCCKICTTGKACGDTCIARNKTCRQPPGCACDG